ncbi:hypothetical protein E1B28_010931 [Marasmius oreades]|uniref:Uncharacterized protein n=1 Tax=Marasmius oreades TaxID=181124 RepID=A0A9P7RT78_9AGAR|nr:uncharacterized protein E1B28_010931 [Marasmius oreades]KAG7089232.1 hypothetical protein E1B28_010931 [Marasmius oreades]
MDIAHESRVYARALYPLGHGCALWIPEPNDALSEPYRETGVRIGDVGILTIDGGFDFIFNICCSADDPINQYGVPEGFQPLAWDGRRFERANRFRAGIPLCSRDTKQWDLSVRGVASLPGLPAGAGGGIRIRFCRDRGAILMPPKGASRVDCHNLSLFREYAERHYANWYQFLNGTLGREAENGALYLITGFDKTDCWENAVVCTTSNKQSCEVIFTTGGLGFEGHLKLSRSSILQSSVSSRCSVDNSKHNQALFIRGFRVSMRRGIRSVWRRTEADVVSTYDASWRDSLGRKDGDPPFSRTRPSSSGSDSSQSGSGSSGISKSSFGWQDELLSSPSDVFYYHGDSSNTSLGEEDVMPITQVYHPLDIINEHILQSRRDAEVVITHDNDLVSLLQREDTDIPEDQILISRLEEQLHIKVEEGCARLALRPRTFISTNHIQQRSSEELCNIRGNEGYTYQSNQSSSSRDYVVTAGDHTDTSVPEALVPNDLGDSQSDENPFFYSPFSPSDVISEEPLLSQEAVRPSTCCPASYTRTAASSNCSRMDPRPQTATTSGQPKRKPVYLCDVPGCGSPVFDERRDLVYHILSSHQATAKNYQCSRCHDCFPSRQDLTLHFLSGESRCASPEPKRIRFEAAVHDGTKMRLVRRMQT